MLTCEMCDRDYETLADGFICQLCDDMCERGIDPQWNLRECFFCHVPMDPATSVPDCRECSGLVGMCDECHTFGWHE